MIRFMYGVFCNVYGPGNVNFVHGGIFCNVYGPVIADFL